MKTHAPKPHASASSSHSPKPFFSKNDEGTFFPWSQERERPFFSPPPVVQTKPSIGQPGDEYEQEADAMAEKIVGHEPSKPTPNIQTKCEARDQEEKIQKKEEGNHDIVEIRKSNFDSSVGLPEEKLQAKSFPPDIQPTHDLESNLQNSKRKGNPLPKKTRQEMELGFGANFENVQVHSDYNAVKMSRQLGARAFTYGSDIYFNEGEYDTKSNRGQKLIAHELTHVIQHRKAGARRISKKEPPKKNPAGGCGVCYGGNTLMIGSIVHRLIQLAFQQLYNSGDVELTINIDDKKQRVDLILYSPNRSNPKRISIGEIKPFNQEGKKMGKKQLFEYRLKFMRKYPQKKIDLLRINPIEGLQEILIMPNPFAKKCDSQQKIGLKYMAGGLYGYYCKPNFKELIKKCKCVTPNKKNKKNAKNNSNKSSKSGTRKNKYLKKALRLAGPLGVGLQGIETAHAVGKKIIDGDIIGAGKEILSFGYDSTIGVFEDIYDLGLNLFGGSDEEEIMFFDEVLRKMKIRDKARKKVQDLLIRLRTKLAFRRAMRDRYRRQRQSRELNGSNAGSNSMEVSIPCTWNLGPIKTIPFLPYCGSVKNPNPITHF